MLSATDYSAVNYCKCGIINWNVCGRNRNRLLRGIGYTLERTGEIGSIDSSLAGHAARVTGVNIN
jgi:hypothetical protein